MALSKQSTSNTDLAINADLLEKVIIGNDLSGLSSIEKVQYIKGICQTLGLNMVTKPIQLLKLQGKEIPYFTKDASEQLRKINKVSIIKIDKEMLDGGLYIVTTYASTPDGRQDSSTGVIVTSGLRGDALANAMMKAETKSKRRVTLSICGLGFIDETEVESIQGAQKIDINDIDRSNVRTLQPVMDDDFDTSVEIYSIENCKNLNELKDIFESAYRKYSKRSPEIMIAITEAKDKRKDELTLFDDDIPQ